MSEKELHSYRLSSLEEPTDEMLQTLMEQIGEAARQSMAEADAEVKRRLCWSKWFWQNHNNKSPAIKRME